MTCAGLELALKENKAAVDKIIFEFLPSEHRIAEVALLYRMMTDYPSRPAKGLRPFLCIATCEAFGGDREQALVTAAALELFQNWILIHDDIEDGSILRRGELALHQAYGVPLAINAGDALHGKMWELLLKNGPTLGEKKTLQVLSEFSRMFKETTEGQHMELEWVRSNRWDLSEEDYLTMCEKKTSWYTCITPCRLGALIADALPSKLDEMIPFGRSLGIAFQIRDDTLNLIGEESKYGKEVGGDIVEGKRTLLLIELLRRCSSKERREVLSILEKDKVEKTPEDIGEIIDLMKESGAIEYAEKNALSHAEESIRLFHMITSSLPPSKARRRLESLIGYMVRRDR